MNSEKGRNWMQLAVFLTLAIIVMNSIYEVISDGGEVHYHEEFFLEMRDFKESYQDHARLHNLKLCERVTRLEQSDVDCNKLYNEK